MRHWSQKIAGIVFLGIAFWGPSASAWDTKETVSEASRWRSIYLCSSAHGSSPSLCADNEHERLADRALSMVISGNNPYAISAATDLHVIDLNASYFRYDLFGAPDSNDPISYERQPDTWAGPLEERNIPNPPHFSGVADFTYSIYDWINKNRLCPPIASGELEHCHNYSVWLGAGFNSSHFGTQATLSYQQLHQTALSLAAHASSLRQAVNAGGDATREAHRDAVREAERMALAYESAAQHFLQDRWSTGHMWERWNSPDYASNPYRNDIGTAAVIGAVTGIIHGSEAVLGQPLHLSSPRPTIGLFGRDGVSAARWTSASGGETHPGVGDYRVNDMFRGRVGRQYAMYANTDWPLNVSVQQNRMMNCLAGGFYEVISAFGRDEHSGGFGIEGVQLSGTGSSGVSSSCFDTWATNRSILIAWGPLAISDDFTGTLVPLFVRMMLPSQAGIDSSEVDTNTLSNIGELIASHYGANISLTVDRASLTRISSRILWNGTFRGDETSLARGGMGPFGRAQSGGYGAPDYLEPTNLSSLPAEDPRGRDRNAIFGFFNRAQAGEYCQGAERRLEELRLQIRTAETTEDRDRYRGVCQVLAQRLFYETRPSYRGRMSSHQVAASTAAGATNVQAARPLCYVQPQGAVTSGPEDDTLPFYLHQGYVPFNPVTGRTNQQSWADTFNQWGYAQQSVANWCDQTPVIDTLEDDEHAINDVVAIVSEAGARIELYGMNFGAGRGRVLVGRSWETAIEVEDVIRWYTDRITFALGDQFDDVIFENDETYIFVEKEMSGDGNPHPGARSVGRFVLLSEVPRPTITSMRVFRGNEVFYAYRPPVEDIDIGPFGSVEDDEQNDDDDEPHFRPVTPGEVTVEVEFNMNIDREAEGTLFQFAGQDMDGRFRNRRRWRGTVDISDLELYRTLRGVQAVLVNVKAEDGEWTDSQPNVSGAQPDDTNKVLVDTIPLIVERIQVRDRRRTIYAAEWTGGPDLEDEPSLVTEVLGDPERLLRVSTAEAAPARGQGRLRLELSSALEAPPTVTVGGAPVEMSGEGARWRGTFDFEEAAAGAVDGDLPIRISATDDTGKGLDADPRSVTQIIPIHMIRWSDYWARYEANRGDENTSTLGGADTWHRIGEPPAVSMVIILDASGSMGENSGRIENARAGIEQTLNSLPEDQRIELGGIIFYDCSNIQTIPFTRNIESVRNQLIAATPSGGTPLGGAYLSARSLFARLANPGALDWRYVTFTDGAETCDGDAAGTAQRLERLLRDHRSVARGQDPEDEEPVRRAPLPVVACTPSSWRAYTVEIEGNGSDFDDIALVNHWFIERVLPDGRCFNRLESKTYNVYYGSARNQRGGGARSDWGINSRASDEVVEFGTSREGAADLDRVRNVAQQVRGRSVALDAARGQIGAAVTTALQEQEGS